MTSITTKASLIIAPCNINATAALLSPRHCHRTTPVSRNTHESLCRASTSAWNQLNFLLMKFFKFNLCSILDILRFSFDFYTRLPVPPETTVNASEWTCLVLLGLQLIEVSAHHVFVRHATGLVLRWWTEFVLPCENRANLHKNTKRQTWC